jgi:hypothetical protein
MAVLSAMKMFCNSDSSVRGVLDRMPVAGWMEAGLFFWVLERVVFLIHAHPFPPTRAMNSIGKITRIVGMRDF